MNTKTNILSHKILCSLMMLLMMGWMGNAWAEGTTEPSTDIEVKLYGTNFQDWVKGAKIVTVKTKNKQDLTFELNKISIDPAGKDTKFNYDTPTKTKVSIGYLKSDSYSQETFTDNGPYMITNTLKSITKVVFIQAATGYNRCWGLDVKGDGDTDWVTLTSPGFISPGSGKKEEITINRTNVQLRFYSKDKEKKNSFMTDLEIYGNMSVDDIKDFKIDFRSNPYKVVEPESGLPQTVKITSGSYHDAQHGYQNAKATVSVSGPMKFTIGGCNYSNGATVSYNGNTIAIDTKGAGCDNTTNNNKFATYIYNSEEPAELTFDLGAYCPYFWGEEVEFIPNVITFATSDEVEGKLPEKILCDKQGHAVMPTNVTFYREGWTFVCWTDGTNDYEVGKEYTFKKDVTLTPKMLKNTLSLTDANASTKVVWAFDYRKAPEMNASKSSNILLYTQNASIENEKVDIPLRIDVSKGKITNTDDRINALNDGAEGAQINDNTVLTIPAVYGMKIEINASEKVDNASSNTTTHFGNGENDSWIVLKDEDGDYKDADSLITNNGKTISFVYKGSHTSLDILIAKAGTTMIWGFYKDVTVTYPALPTMEVLSKVITNPDKDNFPNETVDRAGSIEIKRKQPIQNTGKRYGEGEVVTIFAEPSYGYDMALTINDVEQTFDTESHSKDYTIKKGSNGIKVSYTRKKMYKVIATVDNKTPNSDTESKTPLGSVSLSPRSENFYNIITTKDGDIERTQVESWFTEGTTVEANAEAATDYVVNYWTEEGLDGHTSDANTYTFTIGNDKETRTITAHFALGASGTVVFDISSAVKIPGDKSASVHYATTDYNGSTSVNPTTLSNIRSFTIPTNYTIFRDLDDDEVTKNNYSTLRYWIEKSDIGKTDQNHYEPGEQYSFRSEGETLTLIPVFEMNPASQLHRLNDPVIRYDFGRKVKEFYDPTTKEIRKVCAQSIDIDHNEKVFWTSKVWVNVLENAMQYPHTRDVALWCDTGEKGYIRNSELDNWAAIGSGTKFWFPSCVGTKVSILTYSKIKTTKIDGAIPTLDEERTAEERTKQGTDKLYVYSYTTNNSADRACIEIGDDYSYYQWFEIASLAANMVNLHTSVEIENRGKITSVESSSDTEYSADKLEDGGYAFHQGDRVVMKLRRKFGYQFDKLVDLDKQDAAGNPLPVLQMNYNADGTVTVDIVDKDGVTIRKNIPQNTTADGEVSWGDATNSVFMLKQTEAEMGTDSLRTNYELSFNITTHRRLMVCFKEKKTYYITYNAGQYASGVAPESMIKEEGDIFEIPKNTTLYYEGNTLDHWVDSDGKVYNRNVEYKALGKDMRMFPVFSVNDFNILDIKEDVTATWNFARKEGAPSINYEGTKGILVTQIEYDSKIMDLKIDLDATTRTVDGKEVKGKFNNTSIDRPERIQINEYSVIVFPATKGCVASLMAAQSDGTLKIEGTNVTLANSTCQKECVADSSALEAEFITGIYSKSFSVTYKPQTVKKTTINTLTSNGVTYNATQIKEQMESNDKCITFTVAPWNDNDEKIPEITGTATEGGTVTATQATISLPDAVATVHTSTGTVVETYPVHFNFETPTESPVLAGVTVNNNTSMGTDGVIEFNDVPRSGIIKFSFNRTMKDATVKGLETATTGKDLSFKYWEQEIGTTVEYDFPNGTFIDIYGKPYDQPLKVILHIQQQADIYHHHKFDFIVGEDGDINEAINAANGNATGKVYNNTKTDGHRYFIFVPNGEHKLEGNEPLTSGDYKMESGHWPRDEKGKERYPAEMVGQTNGRTYIKNPNVSLIGQSREGVKIWNKPTVEGISYTATIHIDKEALDFYAQDLSLENTFDYWGSLSGQSSGGAGRAAAFCDRGNRSVLKNVSLMSWQDTYFSNNANDDYRGYFEDCAIGGVVDFLCGNGDIWLESCDILLRDRSGNNIAAPSTEKGQSYGYVFNNCVFMPEVENPTQLKGYDWTYARPWADETDNRAPGCTMLNSILYTYPRLVGWGKMGSNIKLRFHEYGTRDKSGNPVLLQTRSLTACAPAAGSDDCVMSADDALKYTVRNVMGGPDGFEPNRLCQQIDAKSNTDAGITDRETDIDEEALSSKLPSIEWEDDIELDDDDLAWNTREEALCYFVFKRDDSGNWKYVTNTINSSVNLLTYGSGYYCVRAANQRGGLGAPTKVVRYTITDPYALTIKEVGDTKGYGWSTICLPFNAKTPEELQVYAVNGDQKGELQITSYSATLVPVEVLNAERGYVVYGPVGTYTFRATSRESETMTILDGNPTSTTISSANISCYVLSNKQWGLGFYRYNGATLAPYRAWLPQSVVKDVITQGLAAGTRGILLTLKDKPTGIHRLYLDDADDEPTFNLSGQRVNSSTQHGILINRKRGKILKH